MELVKWDAYDYVGDYVDVLDWRTSFLVSNERQTLEADIEEKILQGSIAIFECECNGETARLTCATGFAFVHQIIVDLESNFIIREIDKDNYRIDLMNKNNIESVTFVKRVYEKTVH